MEEESETVKWKEASNAFGFDLASDTFREGLLDVLIGSVDKDAEFPVGEDLDLDELQGGNKPGGTAVRN